MESEEPNALGEVKCFFCQHLVAPAKYSGEQFGCDIMTFVRRRSHELLDTWHCSKFDQVNIIERYKWAIMGII